MHCLALPYLAYITVDLNPANWAASVAQLVEHWTSNPVVMGSNPVRGSSVYFHCLPSDFAFPCLIYMCEIDHDIVHVSLGLYIQGKPRALRRQGFGGGQLFIQRGIGYTGRWTNRQEYKQIVSVLTHICMP